MATPSQHRFLLVRAEVRNRRDEPSLRFVEYSQFRLWQYLMANKHSVVVERAGLGLWLPETEWLAHQPLFDQSGPSETVLRLHYELYDDETGLADVVQRFVIADDFKTLRARLLELIPAQLRNSDRCIETVEEGRCVLREHPVPLESIGRQLALLT